MAKQFYGSINLSKLIEEAKEQHSAFNKSDKNGNIYANINVWLNDEEDKFGNVMSIKLAATKEAIEADEEAGKIYIGNCKESETTQKPLSAKDAKAISEIADDLPF